MICAALTPLDASLAPDHAAAVAHCARLLEDGCDGINLLGTTGEATSFSREQRIGVMRAVASSGLPLERFMVGTGAAALDDAVALTRAAADLGFAGALVIPPFYFKPIGDDGVAAFYRTLIERVAHPRLRLYFYNFPQLSGIEIAGDAIAAVAAAHPGVAAGVKDSSAAPGYALTLARRFPDLAIFPSSEAVLAQAREHGFAGCISATLNVAAPLAAAVWRGTAVNPATTNAEMLAVRTAFARHPLVPALRAALAARTRDAAWERMVPPLVPLGVAALATLRAELAQHPFAAPFAPAGPP